MAGVTCDRCGDESNASAGEICGRLEDGRRCEGRYREPRSEASTGRTLCEACREVPAEYILYIGGPSNPEVWRVDRPREARCGRCVPAEAVRVSGFAYYTEGEAL
jgi:hypothetical protein